MTTEEEICQTQSYGEDLLNFSFIYFRELFIAFKISSLSRKIKNLLYILYYFRQNVQKCRASLANTILSNVLQRQTRRLVIGSPNFNKNLQLGEKHGEFTLYLVFNSFPTANFNYFF